MRGGRIVLGVLMVATACSDDGGRGGGSGSGDQAPPGPPEPRGGEVARPTVSGPVAGVPFNAMPEDLAADHGYVEEEFWLEGSATAYEPAGSTPLSGDGRWEVTSAASAPYRTRILVRRPSEPLAADGTVLVEWLNVTRGSDFDSDFALAHDLVLRNGWVWVGVSAQVAGIESGQGLLPGTTPALRQWDPARYGDLQHPGDAFSYDIFSQAAQALRRPGDVDLLNGIEPTTVLATASSQSSFRLATYVNAIHPLADIYDGFSIHKRGRGAAPLDSAALAMPDPPAVRIRTDLDDPVLQFETESDMFAGLRFYEARQPDSGSVVTWEVAGTAHADKEFWDYAGLDPVIAAECPAVNDGEHGPFFRGALQALQRWARNGTAPPTAEPFATVDGAGIARDQHGNARGGVRTPAVLAPNRTVTGEPASDQQLCLLVGQTRPFDAATIAGLYPTHDDYVRAVSDAVDAAVDAGFLLEHDGLGIVAAAAEEQR